MAADDSSQSSLPGAPAYTSVEDENRSPNCAFDSSATKLEEVVEAMAGEESEMAKIVRKASAEIGYEDATGLLNRMQTQCVKDLWQLSEITSQDWQVIGAPIGVALAINREVSRSKVKKQSTQGWAMVRQWATDRKEGIPDVKLGNGVLARFWMELQLLWRMGRLFDYVMPRDHQEIYKHCLIHTRSGDQLKAHIMMLSEVWIITFSVILGSLVSMWSLLPQETSMEVTVVFEVLMGLNQFLVLATIMTQAVTLLNTSAVHHTNAKAFALGCLNGLQFGELLVMVTIVFYAAILLFLSVVRIHHALGPDATSTPAILFLAVCSMLYLLSVHTINYMSCFVMHGAMMAPDQLQQEEATDAAESIFVQERELTNPVLKMASENPDAKSVIAKCAARSVIDNGIFTDTANSSAGGKRFFSGFSTKFHNSPGTG